ncbi:diguanylate cyclase domain-containing protein [Rhizobium oryzicola]|uniref:Diguanylate cyclase n=1 Tax=Rhizobium oryzicola TaxID=1232668 RepID=A0ABT8SU31_9HYPH|nr:diguanylate cyclase [Rhizobium oryzicola]MDO1581408.1 diguanylate cyclase [Rhizobium oryzicola]
MSDMAAVGKAIDPLDELRQHLLRISTSADIDDTDAELVVQSLDAVTLLNQFPEYFCLKDRRGRIVFANAAALAASGITDSQEVIGKTALDLLPPEIAAPQFQMEQDLMSRGLFGDEREELIPGRYSGDVWLLTSRTPLRNRDGQVVGLLQMSRDITDKKKQERLQQGHAAVLEMVARGHALPKVLEALCHTIEEQLEGIYASVLILDADGSHLRHGAAPNLPHAYTRLIDGIEIGPRVGSCGTAAWRRASVVVRDIDNDPLWANFRDLAIVFGLRSCWSTPIVNSNGDVLGTFALYSSTVREPQGNEMELAAMATDLASIAIERAQNEERIRHMAHHDPLTGLPNRAMFWPQFSRALHEARRESRKVTVTYIDLDNFKQINDGLGHATGDEVLRVLAHRITNTIRTTDLAVRLGGDEFAIVFSNPFQDQAGVLRRLNEIKRLISEPVDVDGRYVTATCSMGVAFFPQDGETPEDLLAQADRAMYQAKSMGRDTLQVSGQIPPQVSGRLVAEPMAG